MKVNYGPVLCNMVYYLTLFININIQFWSVMEQKLIELVRDYSSLRWISTLVVAMVIVILLYKLLDVTVPKIVRSISLRAYNAAEKEALLKWRRLETFVHVVIAAVKVLVLFGSLYVTWRMFNPNGAPVAVITASAIAIILLGNLLGPILRDVAQGTAMIAERWYNVGDHIQIIPFQNIGGIVE